MSFKRKTGWPSFPSRPVTWRRACDRRIQLSPEPLEPRTVPSTVTWTNPAGGDWNTPANWSTDAVPNSTEDAVIHIAVSGPIVVDSSDAANSLTDTTASLDIDGGSLSLAATSAIGQGVTLSSGGELASAGDLTIGGALDDSDGVLTGAGTVTVNGALTWTGGTMSGSGTTLASGGLQLGQDGDDDSESLDARTLQNAGSATWADTNSLNQDAHSLFQNLKGASLAVAGATISGTGTLENQGTIMVKAGSGTASLGVTFNDEGTLEVDTGTLVLSGGGNVSGDTTVDAGATLQFTNLWYDFASGSAVLGQGVVTFSNSSGTTFESGSSYSFSGETNIQSGAGVVFDATASTSTLDQSSGSLGGSGTFTIGGMTTWTGGTMTGSGITNALGGLTLGASGDTDDSETLASRMLLNAGAGIWYGPDVLDQEEDSTFLNATGATLQIEDGGTWDTTTAPRARHVGHV